jgi:hypothetical protein
MSLFSSSCWCVLTLLWVSRCQRAFQWFHMTNGIFCILLIIWHTHVFESLLLPIDLWNCSWSSCHCLSHNPASDNW